MKLLLMGVISLLFFSCSTRTDKLEDKIQTVQFHYINWATPEDIHKFELIGDSLAAHCVFVEPADTSLKLPDTIGYTGDVVQFTGRYYADEGLPKNYIKTDKPVDEAKVFKYTSYKIIESHHSERLSSDIDSAKILMDKGTMSSQLKTLDLSYAAISCTCAQWFESKYEGDTTGEIEYFYLEPTDSTLIKADTLFNGENLPVRISVTGKFYLGKGYPKNYFPTKGDPEPARVFRYNKIKVTEKGRASIK